MDLPEPTAGLRAVFACLVLATTLSPGWPSNRGASKSRTSGCPSMMRMVTSVIVYAIFNARHPRPPLLATCALFGLHLVRAPESVELSIRARHPAAPGCAGSVDCHNSGRPLPRHPRLEHRRSNGNSWPWSPGLPHLTAFGLPSTGSALVRGEAHA